MKRKLQIIYNKNPLFEKCPACKKNGTLHRSKPRNITEKIIKYFSAYKIFRCNSCGWRGYKFLYTLTWNSVRALAFYSVLVVITIFIVRFFLSKVQ